MLNSKILTFIHVTFDQIIVTLTMYKEASTEILLLSVHPLKGSIPRIPPAANAIQWKLTPTK